MHEAAYASAGTRPERAEAAALVDEEANALAAERNEAPFLPPRVKGPGSP